MATTYLDTLLHSLEFCTKPKKCRQRVIYEHKKHWNFFWDTSNTTLKNILKLQLKAAAPSHLALTRLGLSYNMEGPPHFLSFTGSANTLSCWKWITIRRVSGSVFRWNTFLLWNTCSTRSIQRRFSLSCPGWSAEWPGEPTFFRHLWFAHTVPMIFSCRICYNADLNAILFIRNVVAYFSKWPKFITFCQRCCSVECLTLATGIVDSNPS